VLVSKEDLESIKEIDKNTNAWMSSMV
jgi:hypothetical protein